VVIGSLLEVLSKKGETYLIEGALGFKATYPPRKRYQTPKEGSCQHLLDSTLHLQLQKVKVVLVFGLSPGRKIYLTSPKEYLFHMKKSIRFLIIIKPENERMKQGSS
jgi:hypothetical protein